ncbi:hypothetical protein ACIP9H_27520 [Streptomyces sp. NPDC088732]|uniref:hypothetical protein n=1 Tax=Streptomyces sp. NPDC088732 TaxID=3365879 RepID=UPI00382A0626
MVFLLLVPAGLIAVLGLAGYGLGTLGRSGVRGAGREVRLKSGAALLGACAVAMYTWGLMHVAGAVIEAEDGGTDSAPLRPCRSPGPWDRALHVVGYRVEYVPLGFVCETKDGGSYTAASVPGYVNPAAVGFALGAVVCAGAAAVESERRARKAQGAQHPVRT